MLYLQREQVAVVIPPWPETQQVREQLGVGGTVVTEEGAVLRDDRPARAEDAAFSIAVVIADVRRQMQMFSP